MLKPFTIRPESITEGVPITVEIHAPFLKDRDFLTVSNGENGRQTFQVPIKVRGDKSLAEFSLYKSGQYSISLNNYSELLQVAPHKDLTFLSEFGMLSGSVCIALGALILWSIKNKIKKEAGSF